MLIRMNYISDANALLIFSSVRFSEWKAAADLVAQLDVKTVIIRGGFKVKVVLQLETLLYGARNSITLLKGSLASPARPTGRSSSKMKMYEQSVRMVTAVGKGREILMSH